LPPDFSKNHACHPPFNQKSNFPFVS